MKRRGLKRRVAVLFDAIEDDYQEEILRGLLAESTHSHVELVCIAGGVVGASRDAQKRGRNYLFDLFDPESVDGMILLSGSLGNRLGPTDFAAWVERFRGTPMVHLGIEVPGFDSIVVDGSAAMHQLVTHLITTHGRKRIAFIRGPVTSQEAEERYAAYQRALADAGIDFDPELVLQGTWLRESGRAAIGELFDTRAKQMRGDGAIVAANDYMALGALDALRERGISVPHDVVLTGFDDLNITQSAVPPLTTVRQPTTQLGQEGLRRLVALMNRDEAPVCTKLSAQVVARGSCGCRSGVVALGQRARPGGVTSLHAALMDRKAILTAELARAARGTLQGVGSGWEERLLNALLADLAQQSSSSLLGTLERMIGKLPVLGSDLATLHAILDVLRQAVRNAAGSDSSGAAQASDVLDDARKLVGDSVARTQLYRGAETLKKLHEITQITASLLGVGSLRQHRTATEARFRELGISALSLGLFTTPGQVTEQCNCLAAYNGHRTVQPSDTFPTREYGPEGLFDDGVQALLVQPLLVDLEPVGVLAFPWGPLEGVAYEQIRELLGVGLKGFQLTHPFTVERASVAPPSSA